MTSQEAQELEPINLRFTTKDVPDYAERTLCFLVRSSHQKSYIHGKIQREAGGNRIGMVDSFLVRDTRKGTGTRLLKAFIANLRESGVDELWSSSISPEALSLRMKLFGGKAMDFYDLDDWGEPRFLPITSEQALQSAKRAANGGHPEEQLGARMDISGLDTTGWEGPATTKEVFYDPTVDLVAPTISR